MEDDLLYIIHHAQVAGGCYANINLQFDRRTCFRIYNPRTKVFRGSDGAVDAGDDLFYIAHTPHSASSCAPDGIPYIRSTAIFKSVLVQLLRSVRTPARYPSQERQS